MLKIGEKVFVGQKWVDDLDFDMIENVVGEVIAIDNSCSALIRFPFTNEHFHCGKTWYHKSVAQGQHSDRNDCLWFNENALRKEIE